MQPQPGFLKCQFSDCCSSCSLQLQGHCSATLGTRERLPPAATGSTGGAAAGPPDNKALKLPVEMRLWHGEEGKQGLQHRVPRRGDAPG